MLLVLSIWAQAAMGTRSANELNASLRCKDIELVTDFMVTLIVGPGAGRNPVKVH